MSIKSDRVASEIIRELGDILLRETNDDLLKTITITHATVTNDLSFSKIYFTTFSEDIKKIEKEINNASSYFRTLLADRLDLRHIPELKFIYDESIEYGKKIEDIIQSIHEKEN